MSITAWVIWNCRKLCEIGVNLIYLHFAHSCTLHAHKHLLLYIKITDIFLYVTHVYRNTEATACVHSLFWFVLLAAIFRGKLSAQFSDSVAVSQYSLWECYSSCVALKLTSLQNCWKLHIITMFTAIIIIIIITNLLLIPTTITIIIIHAEIKMALSQKFYRGTVQTAVSYHVCSHSNSYNWRNHVWSSLWDASNSSVLSVARTQWVRSTSAKTKGLD